MIRFRRDDATPDDLRAACVDNHLVWLRRLTDACGGQVVDTGRLEWAVTTHPVSEATIAVRERPTPEMRDDIDEIIAFCRANSVDRLGCWAADEGFAPMLGPWLEARGLRRGERPNWMALDLWALPEPPPMADLLGTMDVRWPSRFDDWTVPELMCYGPDTWRSRQAMVEKAPQRVWHGVLWDGGVPAGQLSFNATEGDLGVVGLHNFLILPKARTSGLGLRRFDWVSRFALDLGCRYLVANALERAVPLYRAMQFRAVGYGQTWWATQVTLGREPERWQILLAEAIGSGDIDGMDAAIGTELVRLNEPLPIGLTPLQYAAHSRQPSAARRLLACGAAPDVLAAWDLGWPDHARDVLLRDRSAISARRPRSGKTLLHVAVERGDADLARLLLGVGADPTLRDHRFQATPLELALAMRQRDVARVLREHQSAHA